MADHVLPVSSPHGLTAPTPVTTTLRMIPRGDMKRRREAPARGHYKSALT
jgi:hypothetical protein